MRCFGGAQEQARKFKAHREAHYNEFRALREWRAKNSLDCMDDGSESDDETESKSPRVSGIPEVSWSIVVGANSIRRELSEDKISDFCRGVAAVVFVMSQVQTEQGSPDLIPCPLIPH